jgi:hypothetical protein
MSTDKHRMEVLWANAKASKLARKEIAQATPAHTRTTPRGRLKEAKDKK